MKLSKKNAKEILAVSFAVEILKDREFRSRSIGGQHWTDTPPDMWTEDEKNMWDMMFEIEDKLKYEIIKLLGEK